MKIPIWKKWYSYLDDILLEEVDSEYSDFLQVYLSKGRFQLCTEEAIYSYADKYENFAYAFRTFDWNNTTIKNALILGLGLGAIPYMLKTVFNQKDIEYTAVEIDEAVSFLAHKYVLKDLQFNMEIIHADAYVYVMQEQQKFDLICMDIFVGNQIPTAFMTSDYIQQLSTLISQNGTLLYNILEKGNETETQNIITLCKQHFSNVRFDRIEDNVIVYCGN